MQLIRQKRYYIFVVFAFTLSLCESSAQLKNPLFHHLTVDDGLSQSVVYEVFQDRQGFLWFGTGSGLNRYDGFKFIHYFSTPGDPTSLSDNHVRRLQEVEFTTKDGEIISSFWIGTQKGLNQLIIETNSTGRSRERFSHHLPEDRDPATSNGNDIWSLTPTGGGKEAILWAGGAGVLNAIYLNLQEEAGSSPAVTVDSIRPFYMGAENSRRPWAINGVIADTDEDPSHLWIATMGGGLAELDLPSGEIRRHSNDPSDPSTIGSNFVLAIFRDSRGRIWCGTYGGGLNEIIESADGTVGFRRFKADPQDPSAIGDNRVFSIAEDHSGRLWTGTFGGGLSLLETTTMNNAAGSIRFRTWRNDPEIPATLSNDFIRKLFIDRSNNLWLGTNSGLNRLDLKPRKFEHICRTPYDTSRLADNYVLSITMAEDQSIWVGTNAGVDRLDQQNNRIAHWNVPDARSVTGGGYVYSLIEGSDGLIWLGTYGGGLSSLDRNNGKFVQYQHDEADSNSLAGPMVVQLLEDLSGRLWVGTLSGLDLMNRKTGTFTHFKPGEADPESLADERIHVLAQNRFDSTLWIGTSKGLHQFDPSGGTVMAHYTSVVGQPAFLSNNSITAVWMSAADTIWIGTDIGLNRLDRGGSAVDITHFLASDGLANSYIRALIGDDQGRLWIATAGGITRYDKSLPEGKRFRNFDVNDGLQANEFNKGAFYKQKSSGELFFGGINGFNRFLPSQVRDNLTRPPVALTGLRIGDEVIASGAALGSAREVILSYEDRFIAFEYVALDFTNPLKHRFAHRLEGFDADWIETDERRFVTYTNLDPGTYDFHIRAANNDGIWSTGVSPVHIRVHPPFWATWWFRILLAIGIISFAYWLHEYRLSKQLAIERMRVQIASDLHDDVGASLTKISLYSDLIRTDNGSPEKQTVIENIGRLSRELVGTMSDIVWSIDTRNDTFADLIDRMRDFASGVLSAKGIDYTFDVTNMNPVAHLPIDFRQNVYLIFKESVNNAARHSGAEKVDIRIQGEQAFIMEVIDNGKGIDEKNSALTGNGIRNMRMRAERLDGKLEIETRNGMRIRLIVKY